MRLVGVAAAALVANATAVPVLCGAIDAVWQEQAAVAGNYPECESYYDSSNLDQTVDLDSDHPHMARFNACKRYGATTWACPTIREHELNDGAESEQTEEETHESLMARRFRKRAGWKVPGIERREVTDDTEPEQADEANRESTTAGRLCKRNLTTAHWGCPGAGKREVQATKGHDGNWPPHKREDALAASNDDAKVDLGLDVASKKSPGNWPPHTGDVLGLDATSRKSPGNWPPYTGDGLGLGVASKPPSNWPPHKREEALAASNVDAKVGPGLDVASKSPGNWPPHTREGLELNVASKSPGNWPPHTREGLELNVASKSPGNWPPHTREGLELDVASKSPGNWPPHKRLDVADEE